MLIDLVIPTMWKCPSFYNEMLEKYSTNGNIKNVIIINNNKSGVPEDLFLNHKIKIISPNENIFVGPSWNLGVELSNSELVGIVNDDLIIDNSVFDFVSTLEFNNIDIIGNNFNSDDLDINLKRFVHDKNKPLGEQCFGFGSCFFIKKEKYVKIPNDFTVLYTDDFLVHNCENIFVLNTNKITGSMCTTVNTIWNEEYFQKIIKKDCDNGLRLLNRI
jgi:hypothetical protein